MALNGFEDGTVVAFACREVYCLARQLLDDEPHGHGKFMLRFSFADDSDVDNVMRVSEDLLLIQRKRMSKPNYAEIAPPSRRPDFID